MSFLEIIGMVALVKENKRGLIRLKRKLQIFPVEELILLLWTLLELTHVFFLYVMDTSACIYINKTLVILSLLNKIV